MLPPRPRAGLPSWAIPTIAAVGALAVVFFAVGMYCFCRGRKSKKERARVASDRMRSGKSYRQESRNQGSEKYTEEKQGDMGGWGPGGGLENTRGRSNHVRTGVTPSSSNESMRSQGRYPRMSSDGEQPSQSYQMQDPAQFSSTSQSTPLAPPHAPWERDSNRTDSTSSFDSIAPLTKGRSGRLRDERTGGRAERSGRTRGEDGRGGNGFGDVTEQDHRHRLVDQRTQRSSSQPRNDIERPRSSQSRPIGAQGGNGFVVGTSAGGRESRRGGMPPIERQRSAPAVTQRPTSEEYQNINSGRRSAQGLNNAREDLPLMNDRFSGSDSPPRRSSSTRPASSYNSPSQPFGLERDLEQDSELAYNTQYNAQQFSSQSRSHDSTSDEFAPPPRYRPQRSRTESPQRPEKSLHRPPPTMAAAPRSRDRVGSSGSRGEGVLGPRGMRSRGDSG